MSYRELDRGPRGSRLHGHRAGAACVSVMPGSPSMPSAARSATGLATFLLAAVLACPQARAACAPDTAQDAPPAETPVVEQAAQQAADVPGTAVDAASEARAALAAIGRLEDADTGLSLADQGEFRESARAASKALHVALQTGNIDLLGKAYRDLAIAFSYAGQLERAEQFANLALKYPGQDPTQVNGPARKVLGDVRTRQQR